MQPEDIGKYYSKARTNASCVQVKPEHLEELLDVYCEVAFGEIPLRTGPVEALFLDKCSITTNHAFSAIREHIKKLEHIVYTAIGKIK